MTMRATRWIVLLLFIAPAVLFAQQINLGGIEGTVSDVSGALISGAHVVAVNMGTTARSEATTGQSGDYQFVLLPIGAYTVTVTQTGFKTAERTEVQVISGENSTVNIQLAVGQVSQAVSVTASAVVVDTTSVNMGTTRTVEELEELPVGIANAGSREAAGFLKTIAGVAQVGYGPDWMQISRGGINGTPASFFGYMIDGVDAGPGESETGEDFIAPQPDIVSEARVTQNTDTSVGFNGGVAYELTLKSGTNSPHGSFYYYGQNNYLNAHNWFSAPGSQSLDNNNELGFTVGGPVYIPKVYNGKDKTFFFTGIDVYREDVGIALVGTIPTMAMRSGDFTQLLGSQVGTDPLGRSVYLNEIYNPKTSRSVTAGQIDPTTGLIAQGTGPVRDPFNYGGQLNVMNPADFSKVSTYFQNNGYLPPTNSGIYNNVTGSSRGLAYKDQFFVKIDQNIGDKQRLSGALERNVPWFLGSAYGTTAGISGHSQNQYSTPWLTPLLSTLDVDDRESYRLRFNYFYTINPRLVFTFAAGTTRDPSRKTYPLPRNGAWATGASAAGLTGTLSPMIPYTSIQYVTSGYGGGNSTGTGEAAFGQFNGPGVTTDSTRQVLRTGVDWSLPRHLMKFGVDWEFLPYVLKGEVNTPGSATFLDADTGLPSFTAGSTGWGWASFLTGAVNNMSVSGATEQRFTSAGWGFYAQDTWRATSKLTINYGLRWDLYVPANMKHDEISTFDPTVPNPGANGLPGALAFYGTGPGRNGYHNVFNYYSGALGPRVGFAYALTPQTVVRGDFAVSYYPMWIKYIWSTGSTLQQAGFTQSASVNESSSGGLNPAIYWDNGFPGVYPPLPNLNPALLNGQSIQYLDRSQNRPPMAYNIGFEIERQLPWLFSLRAAYVGTLVHRLPLNGPNLDALPLADISYGNLLFDNINSPAAQAAGIPLPYPGFNGSVSQALTAYPQYSSVSKLADQWGQSNYNALQINLQRHFGGLTMLANYTISKWLTDGTFVGYLGYGGANNYQHPAFRNTEARQLASLDHPQVLNISWVYELPFGTGKKFLSSANRLEDLVVGGWRLSAIQVYQKGTPLAVTGNQSIPGVGPVWVNRNPGVPLTLASCGGLRPFGSNNRLLNPAAFSEPAPFAFGNSYQLGNVRGCGYLDEDITFDKSFTLYKESRFHLGLLFLDAFNRHSFGGIDTGIADPGFGTVSNATGPRVIQYYGRFQF
jgi:hypothetical protein